jgi:spermidine/putrescine transport system ATP-binding protein
LCAPKSRRLAHDGGDLTDARAARYSAKVESLLFDGANSAVLVREEAGTQTEFRIALPQTGAVCPPEPWARP